MSLTIGMSTPRDLLEKAERDLSALEGAAATQDETMIGDALYNFAVTAYHIKDWLKKHRSKSYAARQVEEYVNSSMALSSCRDICNAGKHATITQYAPTTEEVTASLGAVTEIVMPGRLATPIKRVKIVRKDGSRHEAVELATRAIEDWKRFFDQHGV
jgi:hypothetical protein